MRNGASLHPSSFALHPSSFILHPSLITTLLPAFDYDILFALLLGVLQRCESGGIGRRARLRIWYRKVWGFESPLSHQATKNSRYLIEGRTPVRYVRMSERV